MPPIQQIRIGAPDAGPPMPGFDAAADQALSGRPKVKGDPYSNIPALLDRFKTHKKIDTDWRSMYERVWWRDLLYDLSRQWIYYDTKNGWRDKRLAKWIPRPVTNKVQESVNTITSMLAAIKMGAIVRPNGEDPLNVTAAEVGDDLLPLIHTDHKMDQVMRTFDFNMVLYGTAFLHPWWDTDPKTGAIFVQWDRCAGCQQVFPPDAFADPMQPICPSCGAKDFSAAIGADGAPVGRTSLTGRGRTDAVSVWDTLLPPHVSNFDDLPRITRVRWRTREYYEDKHPELVSKITWQKTPTERSMQLFLAIAGQHDISTMPFGFGSSGDTGSSDAEGCLEYETHERPCNKYEQGLFLRVVENGQDPLIVEGDSDGPGPLPYKDNDGNAIFNWCYAPYERIDGRIYGRSVVDIIAAKQDQLNRFDSYLELCWSRMGNPIWVEPKGAEVEKFTGEPGLVVKYMPTIQGAKPERLDGIAPPAGAPEHRQQIIADIESLAGTLDVLKGDKPGGVEAFSALQLLVERSQSRFTRVFNERGDAYRNWAELALELERTLGPKERVLSKLGPNRRWSFRRFQQAHLRGSISIVVEDGSNVPKTSLGERAAVMQVNQLKTINTQDPDQLYAVLSTFGLTKLVPSLDSDVTSALNQHYEFEQWVRGGGLKLKAAFDAQMAQMAMMAPPADAGMGAPAVSGDPGAPPASDMGTGAPGMGMPPPQPPKAAINPLRRLPWHNDLVHITEDRKYFNSDSFRELLNQYPELEDVAAMHLQEHYLAMAPPMTAPVAGGPGAEGDAGGGAGQGQTFQNSMRESGNPADAVRETAPQDTGLAAAA